jgi:hypothetical protein
MEREQPYLLEVELARGTLNRLRNQLSMWEQMGLVVDDSLREQILEATRHFSRAATLQSDRATAATTAQRSLETTAAAMDRLADAYAKQALSIRRSKGKPLSTLLGIQLGNELPEASVAGRLLSAFNLVSVPLAWRAIEATEGTRNWYAADAEIEWVRSAGLKVAAGPLLELDDRGVPDWTYLWEGDLESLLSFMLDHVRAVVTRYKGKVQLWHVAARMCHGHVLSLNEEQRLQITAQAIAALREIDPTTPVIVSFDQPWAEHLASEQLDLAPLHFADALARADLGMSGIGLELNVGYHPGGTLPRSPLAYSRLIDNWSLLELPLMVLLTVPSGTSEDRLANGKIRVLAGSEVTPATQSEWVERHVPLLMAKSTVQVVLWNQLSDAVDHDYPHGGLFDEKNEPKPALGAISKVRKEYLD